MALYATNDRITVVTTGKFTGIHGTVLTIAPLTNRVRVELDECPTCQDCTRVYTFYDWEIAPV